MCTKNITYTPCNSYNWLELRLKALLLAFHFSFEPYRSRFYFTFFFFFFSTIREGIIRCILATDMARHNEILTQFIEITPVFDYNNRAHINLVSDGAYMHRG